MRLNDGGLDEIGYRRQSLCKGRRQWLSWDECGQTRSIQSRVEFGEKYGDLGPQLGEDVLLGL